MRIGLVVGGVAVSGLSCLAPTEITVELTTDVACNVASTNEVGVAVSTPGDETASFGAVGTTCVDGGLGSVVVLPHGIDETVGIRVVLGVDRPTSLCTGPQYAGCIVARRSLSFIPHTPLTLPIQLQQSCTGIPCDPSSTCVSAQCVDAGTTCGAGSCDLPDAGTPPTCVEYGPIVIATQAPVTSPHIARFDNGYAIAYEASPGVLRARMVDDLGNVIAPDVDIQESATGSFGPIGSNGAGYAVTHFDGTSTTTIDLRTATAGAVRQPMPISGQGPPIGGVVWDNAAGHYVFVTSPLTGGYVDVFEIDQNNFSSPVGITNSTGTNSSLAIGDQSVYVAFNDSSCYLFVCAYSGGSVVCPPASAPTVTVPMCGVMRVAAGGSNFFGAALTQAGVTPIVNGVVAPSFPATVDSPLTLVATTAGPTDFRIVYRSSGQLLTTTFPAAAGALPITGGATGYSGLEAGFDAVGDGPTSPGYGVVYYQFDANAPTIEFVHHCK